MTDAILLAPPPSTKPDVWLSLFKTHAPALEVRLWPHVGAAADIKYAAVGRIPPGELAKLPNLKLILNLFAGLDILQSDPHLPNVPIARTDDPTGDRSMSEIVLLHVLRHHRQLPAYAIAQSQRDWISLHQPWSGERRVGVLGLGPLGTGAATTLSQYGFDVAAWTRNPRGNLPFTVFTGRDTLRDFLGRTEIVVNLLPLNPETEGILNRMHLSALPQGASVINLARGGHVVDNDLIALLDEGHLSSATLDVFRVEPLPANDPLWGHPRITITPHAARRLDVAGIVARIARTIETL